MNNRELVESLNKKIAEYRKIIDSMTITIKALESDNVGTVTVSNNGASEYNPSWPLSDKVSFFFKRELRFLHNRELAVFANELEPNVSINVFVGKFSAVLSRLKKEGHLTSIQKGKSLRNFFWGSKKWLDQDGEPKKGYALNEDYVLDKDKKKVELFD